VIDTLDFLVESFLGSRVLGKIQHHAVQSHARGESARGDVSGGVHGDAEVCYDVRMGFLCCDEVGEEIRVDFGFGERLGVCCREALLDEAVGEEVEIGGLGFDEFEDGVALE
jgi:hypothetical protein